MHAPLPLLLADLAAVPKAAPAAVDGNADLFAGLLAELQAPASAAAKKEPAIEISGDKEEFKDKKDDAVEYVLLALAHPMAKENLSKIDGTLESSRLEKGLIEKTAPEPRTDGTESAGHPKAAQHAAPAHTAEIREAVHSPNWDIEVGKTVVSMAQMRTDSQPVSAEIRIHPPELGPMSISVTLGGAEGKEATVAFACAHHEVREAIEAALPQLREALAGAGIQLGHASVGSEGFSQKESPAEEKPAGQNQIQAVALPRAALGLVDTFV